MLTVLETARKVGKSPQTVRRWIREGKLRSTRSGTQHLVDEADLDQLRTSALLPAPAYAVSSGMEQRLTASAEAQQDGQ